jgi:hypothetical protein
MYGVRLVVPTTLRTKIFSELEQIEGRPEALSAARFARSWFAMSSLNP